MHAMVSLAEAYIKSAVSVFSVSNSHIESLGKKAVFKTALVGATNESVLNDGFLTIKPHLSISESTHNHLIIIPASRIRSYETANENIRKLINWILSQYKQGAEVASMCIGGFMLV